MTQKNGNRKGEYSVKCTTLLGRLGPVAGTFRELKVDKLIGKKLPKRLYEYSDGLLSLGVVHMEKKESFPENRR